MTAGGYWGRVLRVDLAAGRISVETHDDVWLRTYFGGSCTIAQYLLRELKPSTDPLGPSNRLIFATGPLTGVSLPGLGRNSVGARSPLTGAIGFSEAGGFWGAELKRAGYDAIVLEGRAAEPCYLHIIDDQVELHPASHLWGLPTGDVERMIKSEVGDANTRIAQCGIAGERGVRFASIVNDLTHFYGRTGMGAVMASKNLRAVAVRGHKRVPVADEAKIGELRQSMKGQWQELAGGLHDSGTAGVVMSQHATSGLPTRNFTQGQFEGAELVSGQAMRDSILAGRGTCYACPITCKRIVETDGRWEVDPLYGGPEYETIGALGSLCAVDSLPAIGKANELCAKYCMDTISTGVTIAFAMECFEEGLFTLEDTGGIDLRFGNADSMVEMVRRIAEREGLGDLLAEGSARAAAKIGAKAPDLAMHIKGQEMPLHEPRVKHGHGLSLAFSPTGADHMNTFHDTSYTKKTDDLKPWGILEPLPIDDLGPGKVRMIIHVENWKHFRGCSIHCALVPWSLNQIVEIVSAVTGWETSLYELAKVGERAHVLARMFNLREGFTDRDDSLPKRFLVPFETGPAAGSAPSPEAFEAAKRKYYEMSGWDPRTGVPLRWKLEELNIAWAEEGRDEYAGL
jgi:aldehyde:ferredoxin oxidoreductase